MQSKDGYDVRLSSSAARALESDLPESIATAVWEFIDGPLREDPRRVGKQLREPLFPLYSARHGEYRVLYRIEERVLMIDVVRITYRLDVYRRF